MRAGQPVSERAMLDLLENEVQFPPLRLRVLRREAGREGPDAVVQMAWAGRTFKFDAELKARSTPRRFEEAIQQAQRFAQRSRRYPLVVLPYLRPEQLQRLQRAQVSGIDLCGNGVVIV